MRYLATSFSVSMLPKMGSCEVSEVTEKVFMEHLQGGFKSIVGHEETAKILSKKLGVEVAYNRESVTLNRGDELLVAVPQFRAERSREFTLEEIVKSEFRYFIVDSIEKWWGA